MIPMRTFNFTMDTGNGSLDMRVERFSSGSEVISVCKRRPVRPGYEDCAFLHPVEGHALRIREGWCGFSSVEELESKITGGLKDADMLAKVHKYSHSLNAPSVAKYRGFKNGVCGGGVNVPRYLAGAPDCMRMPFKSDVKSDMIKLAFNVSLSADVSKQDLVDVGAIVARIIVSLEKAGYRVGVDAMVSCTDTYSGLTGRCLVLPVKSSEGALSLPRLLFALTDISLLRGLFFSYLVQDEDFELSSGLGTPIERAFDRRERDAKLDEFFSKIEGKDTISFDFAGLVDIYSKDRSEKGKEKIENLIISKLLDTGDWKA